MRRLACSSMFLAATVLFVAAQPSGCGGDEATFADTGSGAASQGGSTSQGGAAQGGGAQGGAGQGGAAQGGAGQGGAAQGGAGQGGAGQGGGAGDCGPCGANEVCDPQLGCVDCIDGSDCMDAGLPICVLGSCEECGDNGDCALTEYCHPTDYTCEPACVTSNDCQDGDATICDTLTGTCVECVDGNDCPGGQPLCSPAGVCVECLANGDCPQGDPVCDVTDGECVECVFNSDCAMDQCIDKECGG